MERAGGGVPSDEEEVPTTVPRRGGGRQRRFTLNPLIFAKVTSNDIDLLECIAWFSKLE